MNDNVSKEEQVNNVTLQLQEIEMLTAMFPNENEIIWHDPLLLIDAQQFCETNGKEPSHLNYLMFELTLNVPIDSIDDNSGLEISLKLSVTLPTSYPQVYPELSIISDEMKRTEQTALKVALDQFMENLERNEIILLELITWLQENTSSYFNTMVNSTPKEIQNDIEAVKETSTMTSMWLYMHHIYSKTKRKDIQHWAHELQLTGFSLPGKPGVVYVEGITNHVEDFFDRLRSLPWKRITCKTKEICTTRTFGSFEELCFDVHGAHNYHMDLGQFYEFLVKNSLGHMFKELFGVEGKVKE